METIAKKIILTDSEGNPVKELKSGVPVQMKVQRTPTFRVEKFKFSNNK